MSCQRCGCNPCSCASCDPNNESAISIMNNMVANQIGEVVKTCENGSVVWELPCNLDVGAENFPRLEGESIDCYFLRYLEFLQASLDASFQPLCGVLTALCALGFPDPGEVLGSNGAGGLAWTSGPALCQALEDICGLTLVQGDILYVDAGGNITNLALGSNGEYLTNVGGIPAYQAPSTSVSGFLIEEIQDASTDGGTFTSGAWQERVLNSIVSDPDGVVVSLAANEFVLEAGTYQITIHAPAYRVNQHQARLFNVTDGVVVQYGRNEISGLEAGGDNVTNFSVIEAQFTIAAGKTLRVEHQCQTTLATVGFGTKSNFSGSSIYTTVRGIKL